MLEKMKSGHTIIRKKSSTHSETAVVSFVQCLFTILKLENNLNIVQSFNGVTKLRK
jgi:hypothetical protein